MSLSSLLRYSLLVCFTCSLTACQQAQDPPQSTAGTSNLQGSQASSDAEPAHRLIGEWQGQLEVAQEAVTELFQREGQEAKLAAATRASGMEATRNQRGLDELERPAGGAHDAGLPRDITFVERIEWCCVQHACEPL